MYLETFHTQERDLIPKVYVIMSKAALSATPVFHSKVPSSNLVLKADELTGFSYISSIILGSSLSHLKTGHDNLTVYFYYLLFLTLPLFRHITAQEKM
jgi:hypothetical protein